MRGRIVGTIAAGLIIAAAGLALAGHHGRRDASGCPLEGAVDPAYAGACGSCHFAYQPGLLPAASWERLLDGLGDHFGNAVDLDSGGKAALRAYLCANAADRSPRRHARKLLRGMDGRTPLRITETSWFRHKHHHVAAATFRRASVGGAGNCPACHPAAARGDYDDDAVRVPR